MQRRGETDPANQPGSVVAEASIAPAEATDESEVHVLDLPRYRAAVQQLYRSLVDLDETLASVDGLDELFDTWLRLPDVIGVVNSVPGGVDSVRAELLREVDRHRPDSPSSANDGATLVRIFLLSQIDAVWWGSHPPFDDAAAAQASPDVVDLEALARRDVLRFAFRAQPHGLPGRARNYVRRRFLPGRSPHTSGLSLTLARRDMVLLLNQLATEFAAAAPTGTPRLWITSLTRTLEHQHRLRQLGYSAVLPSAHCVGYAADLEMRWYRRFGADQALAELLLRHQADGLINVIDEGQAWHICMNPSRIDDLRSSGSASTGGH